MKMKIVFFVLMMFVASTLAVAQTFQEVVYLKNGSVIRGVIIEQIPNVSLRVQTTDGSIFAYQMDEVEKITKEQTMNQNNARSHSSYAFNSYKLKTGYRGFVDFGYSVGVGNWGDDRIELSTTHGYQILPCLFIGAGIGVYCYFDNFDSVAEIPIFADFRATLPCRSICQPFLDFKIGYSVYAAEGFYMNPSIGCRFAVGGNYGIQIGIGYTMQKLKVEYYSSRHWYYGRVNDGAITFKVGFDF